LFLAAAAARAEVTLSTLFSDHMVLQRGKPVPVYGTASPGERITVSFNGRSVSASADAQGTWQVNLAAMRANPKGRRLTVAGTNSIIIDDVLVGDVWLCSGQSNMDMRLGGCNRPTDIAGADYPGIRQFNVPLVSSGVPLKTIRGHWTVCTPAAASGFSATAFYFARRIYEDQKAGVPIGLLVSTVGGTRIDVWLAPEGVTDIPVLSPLYSQKVLPWGPFSLFNGMIYPLAPYGIKGAIWYQGENTEVTKQSADSYFLKMKALVQGWKRLWGMDDFAFYYVMIANWGSLPPGSTPETTPLGGWDADTRLQQTNAMALPHAGMASAIDIGESDDWHPKDKMDVGDRLALWALKNDYGRASLVTSGPVIKSVAVSGSTVVCSFRDAGGGLIVGSKPPYRATQETPGGPLNRFVIAGADGVWYPATAGIAGNTVVVSSPSVTAPRKVSYAFWQNPLGCNLYNREGLPAAPFYVDDVTKRCKITASSGPGGTISPSGTSVLLPRTTALYNIRPKAGYFIRDVRVDGVSEGSLRDYTFDPVYADHTIAATFSRKAPAYTITATSTGGGTLSPTGTVKALQGQSTAFRIVGNRENLVDVTVDGAPMGRRSGVTFTDVRANHTISAAFSVTIKATAGYGGTISPDGVVPVKYNASTTFTFAPIPGYSILNVKVDGEDVGASATHGFLNVKSPHTIAVTFKGPGGAGSVPRTDDLLFACRGDSLSSGGAASWPVDVPAGQTLAPIGAPTVDAIDGHKYASMRFEEGDGFTVGKYTSPIACNGASIVVVAKPIRNGAAAGWTSIVDVFYDRLILGIRNDSGLVCVRRNGSTDDSSAAIPSGQITILSLIVQPDGTYKAYANGTEIMSNTAPSPMTSLVPGVAGPYADSITIGRNAPDAWTAFNGDIGDVYLYKAALTDVERRQLEAYLANKLSAEPANRDPSRTGRQRG
jgi:sialate O-acetylesterase